MVPATRRSLLVLLPLVLAACTAAPHAPNAASAPAAADAARLMSDVRWLADDAREGRRAGTEPAHQCALWIAERMRALGLEPAGTKSYLQEFAIALSPRAGTESWVRIGEKKSSGLDALVPLSCSEPGDAAGELVDCGYGIEVDNDAHKRNDFDGLALKDAVALVRRGTPEDGSDPKSWGNDAAILTKVMNAKRRGAVGVLLLCKDAHDLPAFDTSRGGRAGIPCVAVTSGVFPSAPAAPFEAQARRPVMFHADVVRQQGVAYNVLGRIAGADRSRTVVIGAHYDHLGRGGEGSLAPDAIDQIHNGADDNASGSATVLEIARLVRSRGTPACDLLVALWSGEEEGLLGSEHWVAHPTVPLEKVAANLNLDMVGRVSSGKLQVLGAGTSPGFAALLDAAKPASGLELAVSTSGTSLGGSSDHQSFLKHQIPALHFFSGLHSDYHKPSDDADKFEAAGAAQVATLGVEVVERLCAAGRLAFVDVKPPKGAKAAAPDKNSTRAWFGAIPSASTYTGEDKGVLLDGTSNGSPAERAGFLKGDLVVQIADVKIEAIDDLQYALTHYKPGDTVSVVFLRDGKQMETRVTLAIRNPSPQ